MRKLPLGISLVAIFALAVAVLAGVELAGSGGFAAASGEAGTREVADRPTPAEPAAAAAKRRAVEDDARRLREAPRPPGSRPFAGTPKDRELRGAPFDPATPNLVDRGAVFTSPLDLDAAYAWFKAHPPTNTRPSLFSGGSENGRVTSRVVGFDWGEIPMVRERELYVTVVPRPHGSAFRIDAQSTWVSPHPEAAKVPAAARLLELEYTHHGKPRLSTTITEAAAVARFARLIDGAEASQPGEYSCPEEAIRYRGHLSFVFRARRGGPALAEVHQEIPPGACSGGLRASFEGSKPISLEPAGPLDGLALKRLGVKGRHKG
jgi:hypothetical protein